MTLLSTKMMPISIMLKPLPLSMVEVPLSLMVMPLLLILTLLLHHLYSKWFQALRANSRTQQMTEPASYCPNCSRLTFTAMMKSWPTSPPSTSSSPMLNSPHSTRSSSLACALKQTSSLIQCHQLICFPQFILLPLSRGNPPIVYYNEISSTLVFKSCRNIQVETSPSLWCYWIIYNTLCTSTSTCTTTILFAR